MPEEIAFFIYIRISNFGGIVTVIFHDGSSKQLSLGRPLTELCAFLTVSLPLPLPSLSWQAGNPAGREWSL